MRDWAMREAAARPEIVDELAPGAEPDDVLAKVIEVVSPVEETVFASAEESESRYRALAAIGQYDAAGLLDDHPLIGWLIRVVVGPVIASAVLLLLLSFSVVDSERPGFSALLLAVVTAGSISVAVGMLSHEHRRNLRPWEGKVWALAACTAVLLCLMFVGVLGWSWWLLAVPLAAGPLSFALVAGLEFVLPDQDFAPRRRAAFAAFADWREALLREGVLPVLFTRINATAERTYSTTLIVRGARELTRTNPLSMHVDTPASLDLDRQIGRLGGGSFALAGPRGAGKSNLLKAFCGGRYRDPNRGQDLAVLVSAPVEYVPHEFVLHLFAATCRAAIGYVQQLDPAAAKRAGRRRRRVVTRIADDLRFTTPTRLVELAAAAHANRMLVRYVQSYTREAGVKGGFKGLELGGRAAMILERRALIYPELVERFREFLQDAVAVLEADAEQHGREPGRVLIGIDELDRLGKGEPARRFLNEVKAIFDVVGCYYLVSVSTEAQHDFELSGMGLRSVFDSSFDEVVRVDYLDFEHAKKLLRRYVIGLSEQFLALAYVLSGGLARQLVRTARAISEHAGESLGSVAATLAGAELLRTCLATVDALASADDRSGVAVLLGALDDWPAKVASDEFRTYAEQVLAAYQGASERVGELRDLVGARIYFLATVLEVFTEELTKDRLTAIADGFDALARARRYLGVNPTTGIALIDAYCTTWSLPTLECWEG